MKTPTWNEVEDFCRKDGWELVRSTGHTFYPKVLPDGTVLETHTSFSGDKTMSPGRFAAILRTQLKVSPEAFWETLRSGQPARRPSEPIPQAPPRPPAWVVDALKRQFRMSEEQIAAMSPEEAERYVLERWSEPRS